LEKKGKRKRERGNDKAQIKFSLKFFDNMNGTILQINNNGETYGNCMFVFNFTHEQFNMTTLVKLFFVMKISINGFYNV
jgi:hypothetical protein